VNCTVVDNEAEAGSYGGGLYSSDSGEPIVKNSIFANNWTRYSSRGRDIYGDVQSADFNLIENLDGATVHGSQDHHIPPGQDPSLGSLADNGGSALTHALLPGSPAIDAGSCADITGAQLISDQRGSIRPQGLSCDIGAYESPGPHLSLVKEVDRDIPRPGDRITYTVAVENRGDGDLAAGTISDTLPYGLSPAGAITLEPRSAGITGTLPTLVTDLTVLAGGRVTVTLPVTVSASLSVPMTITNTAAVTSEQTQAPKTGSCTIVVAKNIRPRVYLPLVMWGFQ